MSKAKTQMMLFDLTPGKRQRKPVMDAAAARARRDKALKALETAVSYSQFMAAADAAILATAKTHPRFIVDDVWELMPDIVPPDNRVMGAAIRRAVRDGVIAATSEFRASAQRQCHANPRRVWQSLL